MYGRCETDPFDQATDVCDSCYGEFCAACMVRTKGRKHPICKECAIVASGVRPGAKPLLRGSKKTAAERRRALQDAPAAARTFEYFDDEPDATGRPDGPETTTIEPEPEPWPTEVGAGFEPGGEPEVEAGFESGGEPEVEVEDHRPAPEPTSPEPTPVAGQHQGRPLNRGLAALAEQEANRRIGAASSRNHGRARALAGRDGLPSDHRRRGCGCGCDRVAPDRTARGQAGDRGLRVGDRAATTGLVDPAALPLRQERHGGGAQFGAWRPGHGGPPSRTPPSAIQTRPIRHRHRPRRRHRRRRRPARLIGHLRPSRNRAGHADCSRLP